MRISDWSSDVCSSDLCRRAAGVRGNLRHRAHAPSAGVAVPVAGMTQATPGDDRDWTAQAVAVLRREAARSADTHLLHAAFPGLPGIDFYFTDEASHPTGSLQHRMAPSPFLSALCTTRLPPGPPVFAAPPCTTEPPTALV